MTGRTARRKWAMPYLCILSLNANTPPSTCPSETGKLRGRPARLAVPTQGREAKTAVADLGAGEKATPDTVKIC